MALVQHFSNVVNSPMVDNSDPIHIIEEDTGWCKPKGPISFDIPLCRKWETGVRQWYKMLNCRAGSRYCTIFDSWDIGWIEGKVGGLEKQPLHITMAKMIVSRTFRNTLLPWPSREWRPFSKKKPVLDGIDVDGIMELLVLVQTAAIWNDKVDILEEAYDKDPVYIYNKIRNITSFPLLWGMRCAVSQSTAGYSVITQRPPSRRATSLRNSARRGGGAGEVMWSFSPWRSTRWYSPVSQFLVSRGWLEV